MARESSKLTWRPACSLAERSSDRDSWEASWAWRDTQGQPQRLTLWRGRKVTECDRGATYAQELCQRTTGPLSQRLRELQLSVVTAEEDDVLERSRKGQPERALGQHCPLRVTRHMSHAWE